MSSPRSYSTTEHVKKINDEPPNTDRRRFLDDHHQEITENKSENLSTEALQMNHDKTYLAVDVYDRHEKLSGNNSENPNPYPQQNSITSDDGDFSVGNLKKSVTRD